MSFPLVVGAGALTGHASSISPAWPTHQTDDIGILLVETANADPVLSVASGFTQIGTVQAGGSSSGNATRAAVYWARATSGAMTAPTITSADNHIIGRILTVRGCLTTASPINASAMDTTGSSTASTVTFPNVTPTVDNCLILALATSGIDSSTAQFTSWASTADVVNFTELYDSGDITGHGGVLAAAYGWQLTAGLINDLSASIAANFQNRFVIALEPEGAGVAPDETAPVITNLEPSDGTVRPQTVVSFDVTDETALAHVLIAVSWTHPTTGARVVEVVHDGDNFRGAYGGSVNVRTAITDGYHYAIRRDGGWLASPTVEFFPIDAGGNLGVIS